MIDLLRMKLKEVGKACLQVSKEVEASDKVRVEENTRRVRYKAKRKRKKGHIVL